MTGKLTAKLLAPACLVQNRGVGNTLPTLDYIPGATLRGLLAALYLEQPDRSADAAFCDIFLNEAVSFPNLYPAGSQVIPLSALTCKYHGGFTAGRQHGVIDGVLPWLRHFLQPDTPLDAAARVCAFPGCGAPLDRCAGYYGVADSGEARHVVVQKRLLARTAILESREVVRSGDLYTLEALAEGQEFAGTLEAPAKIILAIQELLKAQPWGWLGTAKSRGLGEVELSLDEEAAPADYPMAERLQQFNARLAKDSPVRFFSLTFLSDALILDELLGYRSQPHPADLKEAVDDPKAAILDLFHPIMAWTSPQRLSGWQATWQLPKPEEQAIRRGSVFVYGLKNPEQSLAEQQVQELAAVLSALEERGLGERPTEGFGRLRICHEFHWEYVRQ